MGFVFQRRIKLGGGLGLNLSKSGASPSVRTKLGSVSTKGFSVRTGIPGFYWRSRWGKNDSGITALILLFIWIGYAIVSFLVRAVIFIIHILFQVIGWIFLTLYDFIKYVFAKSENNNKNVNINTSVNNLTGQTIQLDTVNEKPIIIDIQNKNKMKTNSLNIDSASYALLNEYGNALSIIIQKLKEDDQLTECLKNDYGSTDFSEVKIQSQILWELSLIFKLCNDNKKIQINSKEMFGLAFIIDKAGNFFSDWAHNYNNIVSLANGEKPLLTETYLNFCKAIESTIEEHANQLSDNPFIVIYALKSLNHPLFDEYITNLYRFASIIVKLDNVVTPKEEEALKKIGELLHGTIPKEFVEKMKRKNEIGIINTSQIESDQPLEEVIEELESLIGLTKVKEEVRTLVNFVKIKKERELKKLKSSSVSYHSVFTGSPGTGKTTVARIVAKIYKCLGVLEKGQLVETDRAGLIAEYVGQTAIKVDKVVDSAIDGILFIDEAYALAGEGQNDYGNEAIAILIKRMEDQRDKLVVILAGYTDNMESFIEKNPGIRSRFSRYIHFDDYASDELLEIYESFCKKQDYILSDEAKTKLLTLFNDLYKTRDKSFGNARLARNIFEESIENQANRIAGIPKLTKKILTTIEAVDILINNNNI